MFVLQTINKWLNKEFAAFLFCVYVLEYAQLSSCVFNHQMSIKI